MIIEVNEALEDAPESINQSAFVEGWIAKVKLSEPEQLESLLSYEAYNAGIED